MPTQKEQQFYIEQSKKILEGDSDIEGVAILVAKKNGEVFTIPAVKSSQGLGLLCKASQDLPQLLLHTLEETLKQKQGQTKQRAH